MGGVDRVDQQLHGIQATRKSYKWYKKLFVRLVLQSALNSHKIFHQETGMNKVTFLDFLINTIKLMFTATPQAELPPQHVGREDVLRLTGKLSKAT